jgi:hypothetical protein
MPDKELFTNNKQDGLLENLPKRGSCNGELISQK